jgi:hypothetical protein
MRGHVAVGEYEAAVSRLFDIAEQEGVDAQVSLADLLCRPAMLIRATV